VLLFLSNCYQVIETQYLADHSQYGKDDRVKNPFCFRELPPNVPFCNRVQELETLVSRAESRTNVVIYSPRRFGKTSLLKRVRRAMDEKGYFTAYLDFFGVSSIDNLAALLAARLYEVAHADEGLLKKMMRVLGSWRPVLKPDEETGISVTVEPVSQMHGLALLEDTLKGLGKFIAGHPVGAFVVMDEFQEIVDIPESAKIEGLLRTHIQTHSNAAYCFAGSRRRILADMFNSKKRPFYQSAVSMPLAPLPEEEAEEFIISRFLEANTSCPKELCKRIMKLAKGYPYYIQRIPYAIFEECGNVVTDDDYARGIKRVLLEESTVFELMLATISGKQIDLLTALAKEPTASPMAISYMSKHRLSSVGAVQGSRKKLNELDYIEQDERGVWRVVDPFFALWLKRRGGEA
jgi:AAA+ ATPase superfamily predicted ATPase